MSGYYAVTAHAVATERRANLRKLARDPALRAAVIDKLQSGWTPEQIAGRLRLDRAPQQVSHETIYQYAYSKDGHAIAALWRHLPDHSRKRPGRGRRKPQLQRFADELAIRHRPEEIAARMVFGAWECDLIQFRKEFGNISLTSLFRAGQPVHRADEKRRSPVASGDGRSDRQPVATACPCPQFGHL